MLQAITVEKRKRVYVMRTNRLDKILNGRTRLEYFQDRVDELTIALSNMTAAFQAAHDEVIRLEEQLKRVKGELRGWKGTRKL